MSIDPSTPLLELFRPRSGDLAAAREETREETDPIAAWERLAAKGVVPLSWMEGTSRGFVKRSIGDSKQPMDWQRDFSLRPLTVAQCEHFAANAGDVATAEQLAREAAHRLARYLEQPAPDNARILWELDSQALYGAGARTTLNRATLRFDGYYRSWEHYAMLPDYDHVTRLMAQVYGSDPWLVGVMRNNRLYLNSSVIYLVESDASLAIAAAHSCALWSFMKFVSDPQFEKYPNPFAPVVELIKLGVSFIDVTEDAILLRLRD
ncbi:MAG: hypothetical protein Q8S73_11245 [Deltaproteobacteria bacterium]|nr:hypothetical protein [Deltaproteobacteria bacterium]